MIDETRRNQLQSISDKLGENPLLPQIDPITGDRIGGAIDLQNSSLDRNGNFTSVAVLPGWHMVLDKTDAKGVANWGLVHDDLGDQAAWDANHVTVHTTYGGQVVTGEVTLRTAPTPLTVTGNIPDGAIRSDVNPLYITYTDEHGQTVRAYSIDGRTWIRSTTGAAPVIQLGVDLTKGTDDKGNAIYTDPSGNAVFTQGADGGWSRNQDYFSQNPGTVSWYGLENADPLPGMAGRGGGGVGAPGQQMQVVTMSDTGELNLTPPISAGDIWRQNQAAFASKAQDAANLADARAADTLDSTRVKQLRTGDVANKSLSAARASDAFDMAQVKALYPTISQQLPANTPARYEGSGLAPVAQPKLAPVMQASFAARASKAIDIPLPKVSKTPITPKPAPKTTIKTATRSTGTLPTTTSGVPHQALDAAA